MHYDHGEILNACLCAHCLFALLLIFKVIRVWRKGRYIFCSIYSKKYRIIPLILCIEYLSL